jgi:hypothetical protein
VLKNDVEEVLSVNVLLFEEVENEVTSYFEVDSLIDLLSEGSEMNES